MSATDAVLESARADARRAEVTTVKAIEAAILARQESGHVKAALEKARGEASAAADQAKAAAEDVKRTTAGDIAAKKAVTSAKAEAIRTKEDALEASLQAVNAVEAVNVAEQAVVQAEEDVASAKAAIGHVQEVVRVEAGNMKNAKKTSNDATTRVEETMRAEGLATAAVMEAEQLVATREAAATVASKKAYTLREEAEEASGALDYAQKSAEEYEGAGGEWEKRTQAKLKERENEYKRISAASAKATSVETAAETAADDANKKLSAARDNLENRAERAAEAGQLAKDAAQVLAKQSSVFGEAEKSATAALMALEKAEAELKNVKAAAAATTVMRLEEIAEIAKDREKEAGANEERCNAAEAAAQIALEQACLQKQHADEVSVDKQAHAEKLSEREYEAESKAQAVESFIKQLHDKVHSLALATYQARMGAPAFWTQEQGEVTASAARKARQKSAAQDMKALVSAAKPSFADLSVVDKWEIFQQCAADNVQGAEMWNVRRIFYYKDGSVLSGINAMIADIVGSALDRGPPSVKLSQFEGKGMRQASLGQIATFNIIALSEHGIRFEDGGDNFTVSIHFPGLGIRVRPKVCDNNDGSYTVTWRPTATGKCTVRVSLDGDDLPGSPFSCVVSGYCGPTPTASQCTVHGDSLNEVVAHSPERFRITFRNALGQLAHASELDVWVQPISNANSDQPPSESSNSAVTLDLAPEVAQLLKPLEPYESLVVGQTPLDVSRDTEGGPRIGRLQPGRVLKIGKVEPPTEDGLIHARVKLELEDLESKESLSWRQLWPSHQAWRSLSWRAHCIAAARREEAEAVAIARGLEKHERVVRNAAALHIEAAVRGRQGRRAYQRLVKQKKKAAVAAAVAAAALESAPSPAPAMIADKATPSKGRVLTPDQRSRGRGGAKSPKKDSSPTKLKKIAVAHDSAPVNEPSATTPKKERGAEGNDKDAKEKKLKTEGEVDAARTKQKEPSGHISDAKSDLKSTSKGKGAKSVKSGGKKKAKDGPSAEEIALAAKLAEEKRMGAVTRIQAVSRGKSARLMIASITAAQAAPEATGGAEGSYSNSGAKRSRQAKAKGKVGNGAGRARQNYGSASSTGALGPEMRATTINMAPAKLRSPQQLNFSQPSEHLYGWVTLAVDNEAYVLKRTSRLPAHVRQQYVQQWTRQTAIDSKRELERAKLRDRAAEDVRLHGLRDEMKSDPTRIGFAYGGVYPGTLHAKGKLVESHEVQFSIGLCGTYHLFVALRQSHARSSTHRIIDESSFDDGQVPGSPFVLRVLPGKAYPLTTQIPNTGSLMRSTNVEKDSSGKRDLYSCEFVVQTYDKHGYRESMLLSNSGDTALEKSATCIDNKDGTYRMRLQSATQGVYDFFVKLDGLHVIGSPAKMLFGSGQSSSSASDPDLPQPASPQRRSTTIKSSSMGDPDLAQSASPQRRSFTIMKSSSMSDPDLAQSA